MLTEQSSLISLSHLGNITFSAEPKKKPTPKLVKYARNTTKAIANHQPATMSYWRRTCVYL